MKTKEMSVELKKFFLNMEMIKPWNRMLDNILEIIVLST